MAHLSTSFCRHLAKARREKGMTQSALAEAVGCKQSAISMLESGHAEKIAQETVEKIAALLGVAMEPAPASPSPLAAPPRPSAGRAFCPNALCHSNIPYAANGELLFWPRGQQQDACPGSTHCTVCGELLEHRCPHCGAALADGACCPSCGQPKVTNTLPPETDPVAWSAQRRREIAEWRSLIL